MMNYYATKGEVKFYTDENCYLEYQLRQRQAPTYFGLAGKK